MAEKRDYTPHQQRIIRNYYATSGERALTNLQEIVTELYLATTEQKREMLWERARKALEALEMKPTLIEHICEKRDAETLAKHVNDMF